MRRWVLVGLCACRFGFDATGDAGGDAPGVDAAITTITFGERPTSQRKNVTRDAYTSQPDLTSNFGADEDVSIEGSSGFNQHALIWFDLSSVAPGTRVAAARLALTKLDYGDEKPGPIIVQLVTESWTEGTSTGTGASWSTRDGTVPWSMAGGTATQTLVMLQAPPATFVTSLDPAIVQMWIDDPVSNDGVLLRAGNGNAHYHLHARDSQLMSRTGRPELALDLVQ